MQRRPRGGIGRSFAKKHSGSEMLDTISTLIGPKNRGVALAAVLALGAWGAVFVQRALIAEPEAATRPLSTPTSAQTRALG